MLTDLIALSVVREQETRSDGTLRVGLVGEESINQFPALWKQFREHRPGVEVRIHSDTLSALLGELGEGRLDVVLVSGRPRCDALHKNVLVTRLSQVPGQRWLWVVRSKLASRYRMLLRGPCAKCVRLVRRFRSRKEWIFHALE